MSFIITVSIMVLFVTLFNILLTNRYLADFNVILGESYSINTVQNDFDKLNLAFIDYESNKNDQSKAAEYEEAYTSQIQVLNNDLDKLNSAYRQIGIQRYLLTQVVKTSCHSYIQRCNELLESEEPSSIQYIKKYYKTLTVGDHIKLYLKQLMQLTLTQGNANYARIAAVFRMLPIVALALGLFVTVIAFMLNWIKCNTHMNATFRLYGHFFANCAVYVNSVCKQFFACSVTIHDRIDKEICTRLDGCLYETSCFTWYSLAQQSQRKPRLRASCRSKDTSIISERNPLP